MGNLCAEVEEVVEVDNIADPNFKKDTIEVENNTSGKYSMPVDRGVHANVNTDEYTSVESDDGSDSIKPVSISSNFSAGYLKQKSTKTSVIFTNTSRKEMIISNDSDSLQFGNLNDVAKENAKSIQQSIVQMEAGFQGGLKFQHPASVE